MNKEEYTAFINLLMCSDPWPSEDISQDVLTDFADRQAREFGFDDWIHALHEL